MAKPVQKTPETPAQVDPDADLPLVKSFTCFKKAGIWYAVAIESRGTKILREKVLAQDDTRAVALDRFDVAAREWVIHGCDPFHERVK